MNGGVGWLEHYLVQLKQIVFDLRPYLTAEVIANSFDALAFLLVTPEFLPLRRRKRFEMVARRVASALDISTMKGWLLVAHYILVFPMAGIVLGIFAFLVRDAVRWLTQMLPFGWSLSIKIYLLSCWALAGVGFLWSAWRGNRDEDKPPYYLAAVLVPVIGAAVIIESLHIQIPHILNDIVHYSVYLSLAWMMILAAAIALSSLLSRVGRHTLFWIGVFLFFLARALAILHSIAEVGSV